MRGDPNGLLRQLVIAAVGVLAQSAASCSPSRSSRLRLQRTHHAGDQEQPRGRAGLSWLYSLTGLAVVYTYFQIPLMLIVFLPSLDGLRQEWYDASASLEAARGRSGGNIGGPILAPSFLGALFLLFTNAFSAYATAAGADQPGLRAGHRADRLPDDE